MQTPIRPARLERNLGGIALLLLLIGCLLVLRPPRKRDFEIYDGRKKAGTRRKKQPQAYEQGIKTKRS